MKKLLLTLFFIGVLFSCKEKEEDPAGNSGVNEYEAVPVTKTVTNKKIYVHLMPWFETKETSGNGKWGIHWTMNNKNPDNVDAATGKREIAAHFYPMIGPYASGDKDVIEYQLLLMKLSGIDGVLIDWYSTIDLYDYPSLLKNVEKFIALTKKVGLEYALVYEDATINVAYEAKKITDKVAAAQKDMTYIQNTYFKNDNYIKIGSEPLLLTFGPQTFKTGEAWNSIFSSLNPKPKFLTLWYQSAQAGNNASGEFAWVYQDDKSHITHLDNFYGRSYSGLRIASAYPGFKDFYSEGGWGNNLFTIEHNNTETLKLTLDKAISSNIEHIQLVTWNDYGEGTMIEPSIELGYTLLTTIQTTLGVQYKQEDLELINTLFQLRKKHKANADIQKKLDQVFYHLVALKLTEAKTLIGEVQ